MMPRRPADPKARQQRRKFLRNHREDLAGMDFFTVPTATFRVLHVPVTEHPTSGWIIQPLREAFANDAVQRYLVFDNDKTSGPMSSP